MYDSKFVHNYYKILSVEPTASIQEIKAAYRARSKDSHPDHGGSNESQILLNMAFEVLGDAVLRSQFDQHLARLHPKQAYGTSDSNRSHDSSFSRSAQNKYEGNRPTNRNIFDRMRASVDRETERIRRTFEDRRERVMQELNRERGRTQRNFWLSLVALLLFALLGFTFNPLWLGSVISAFFLFSNFRVKAPGLHVSVINPFWRRVARPYAEKRAASECDAEIAAAERYCSDLSQMVSLAAQNVEFVDSEDFVARRILIAMFLYGYVPDYVDLSRRTIVLTDQEEKVVLRYRHRIGASTNIAYVKDLYAEMGAWRASKGYLFSSPGLSGNAAKFAEQCSIRHYSLEEMNEWIQYTLSRDLQGPEGEIVEAFNKLKRSLQAVTPRISASVRHRRRTRRWPY